MITFTNKRQERIDELLKQRNRIDTELRAIQREIDEENSKSYRKTMDDYQEWKRIQPFEPLIVRL